MSNTNPIPLQISPSPIVASPAQAPPLPVPANTIMYSNATSAVPMPYTGYYVTVPSGTYTWNVTTTPTGNTWTLGVDLSGLPAEEAATAKKPKKKRERDGCDCSSCKNFFEFAEPNQKDEESFICYGCRTEW